MKTAKKRAPMETTRSGRQGWLRMPAFGNTLNRVQIEAILAYIKTFWGQRERAFQAEVTKAWEKQQR